MNMIVDMLKEVIRLYSAGMLHDAEKKCREILAMDPNNPDAIHFLGIIALAGGNLPAARELVGRAMELMPQNPSCMLHMGNIAQKEGNLSESEQWYRKAIEIDPQNKKALSNLGVIFTSQGKLDEAVLVLESAVRIDPGYFEAHNNLGEVFRKQGRLEEAMACVEKALALSPGMVHARWNRAILYLTKGDFENGWQDYEWRWKRPETISRKIACGKPWEGEDLSGKVIFVYEEQGLGDTLQFLRYLPLLKQKGAIVVFEVLVPMIRLVESFNGYDRLLAGIRNLDTRPADRFDYHIPLLSLPGMFNTTLDTIPSGSPYLKADPDLVRIWTKRMRTVTGLKVGLCWAGNPGHTNDYNRSIRLSMFQNFPEIEGVNLFGIQKDKYEQWTDTELSDVVVQDLGDEISDFADTAAIIDNLDLVISVDTALVHLAGAMGKEVWTLVPFSPDWRWMTDREDSPWYPTMRLFRQSEPGNWEAVLEKIETELKRRVSRM